MAATSSPRVPRSAWLTIALLSAALLAFQVRLTRVCAPRLHFHFGFLIISNSLLGIGASGSLLALVDARWRRDPGDWTWGFTVAFLLSLPLCWYYLLTAQIPETLNFDDAQQTLQFVLFNLACAVPFFFGGTAVGLILSHHAARVHTVYAADLIGAGLGCLVCPILLWHVGAGGCFLVTVGLAIVAALVAAPARIGMAGRACLCVLLVTAAFFVPRFDRDLPVPGKRLLDVTQEHTLRNIGRSLFSQWSANSRIDVVALPPSDPRFLQARGIHALSLPLPPQLWIAQDGDAGTMLTSFGTEPDKLEVLRQTMYSASFHLKDGTRPAVFVIGVGGAPDLWAAKIHDCSVIKGIELNQAILDVHRGFANAFSQPLLDDPRVELVCDEGRSALGRETRNYDVVQLTGIDTWTALNSGAYVLAENYLYTVEACRAMYERLADSGILQITRMAAGMETIRLMNNMYTALPEDAKADFPQRIAALRTVDGLIAVLLKKGRWTEAEVAKLVAFADTAGIEKVVVPGRDLGSEVEEFVRTDDRAQFVADYPFDIRPTTDDWPYFFSFLRWDQPEKAREFLHQPTWVVQGNPVFLRNQLIYSSLAALLLIVLPVVFRRGSATGSRAGALPFLVYFAALGAGFIGIEIALIQKFTLLLGQPLYSIVVTLFAILVFTGVGSFVSPRVLSSVARSRLLPVGILAFLAVVVLGGDTIVQACLSQPLWVRATVTVAMIAPLALLLGMPFAHGIRLVEQTNPSFVPWAWAVNGSTTVVGSIATVIVSMRWGFANVMWIAAAIYFVAFLAIDRLARRAGTPAAA